ncbi:MAG: hypothetical protein V2A74_00780 [bacterium]
MRFKPFVTAALCVSLASLLGCQTAHQKMIREDNHHRKGRYPIDARGFTPVDRALAEAPAAVDDEEGALNPYVLKVIAAYPTDGSYPYRCLKEPEYDLYNGVTQDMWYQGRVVAKAHPNNTRCSYCCGLTFEIFVRAMRERNLQKGLDPDNFNGMSFHDLFNLLQLWYIEGDDDSPQRGIVGYGLGKAIEDWEQARAGDFLDFSRNNKSGHSVIFINWERDEAGKITGFKYFSSNSKGVGYLTEYFEDSGGKVLKKWFRLARVGSIENYSAFDRTKIPLRRAYASNQPE